jgi:hypothetical protein
VALNVVAVPRKLDRLMQLEENHGEAIRKLGGEIRALEDRVARLEAREGVLIARVEGALAAAAGAVVTASVSDFARWVGVLEERSRSRALPQPEPGEDR